MNTNKAYNENYTQKRTTKYYFAILEMSFSVSFRSLFTLL